MPQPDVQYVQEQLSLAQCAICKKNRFAIDSRSVGEDGNWKALCLNCHYHFPVYTDMEFYLQTQPDVPYRLKDIVCPHCEQRGVTLDFRIIMSVRESRYFVTCQHCRRAFTEQSFLEAYE